MAERDARYNRSKKGRARDAKREQTPARRAYKAKWIREYRKRQRKGGAR